MLLSHFSFLMILLPPRSTLSLHDALPILVLEHHPDVAPARGQVIDRAAVHPHRARGGHDEAPDDSQERGLDRKSTRLNSSHANISYAVFCLKKKKDTRVRRRHTNSA